MYSQHTKDGKNDQPKDAKNKHRHGRLYVKNRLTNIINDLPRTRRLGIDKTDHRLHCCLLAEPRLVGVLSFSTVEQMTP